MNGKNKFIFVTTALIIITLTLSFSISSLIVKEKSKKSVILTDSKKFDFILKNKLKNYSDEEKIPVIITLKPESKKKIKIKADYVSRKYLLLSSLSASGVKVKYKYSLINGFSALVPKKVLLDLQKNLLVKKIWYDKKVHILPVTKGNITTKDSTSRKIIDAETVWAMGYTGQNVTIAIVDTGIDYTHKDLGNCSQSEFLSKNCSKVIGGYDFINLDNNPMDDNNHGTHCAGIAGANGTGLMGVAPGAKLLAVKVLDSNGYGTDSNVIAGIEWAVQNGADVISLSLGASIQPNDGHWLIDQVIDNATEQYNVTVVIAAGNEGPGTGTVGYPGDSKTAITVGASSGASSIASFSCRGPSAFGRLDPDVVAPGVEIYSSLPGNSYASWSGTSMATPHVAGAAALLLSENKNLTPKEIRAILMHNSNNISGHVFTKGGGLINVTRAFTSNITIWINGKDRLEAEVLPGETKNWTLFLQNNRFNQSLNFTIEIENISDIENGKQISKSQFKYPTSIIIENNSNVSVNVNFTALGDTPAGIYGGTIIVKINNSNQFRIPIVITIPIVYDGFVKGTVDDDCSGAGCSDGLTPGDSIIDWGDWLLYDLKAYNSSLTNLSLRWDSSLNDLDFYLLSNNGELVNYSAQGATNKEEIIFNATEETYWFFVRAYSTTGVVPFNVSIDSISGINVTLISPASEILLRENVTFIYNVTSDKGISNCSIYGNFSGSWNLNQTNSSVSNGVNSFFVRLTDGQYKWNVGCYDASLTPTIAFSMENRTIFIDSSPPNIISMVPQNSTKVQGGVTEPFSLTYTEQNLNTTTLLVKNETGTFTNYNLENCTNGTNRTCSIKIDLSLFPHNSTMNYFFEQDDMTGLKTNTSIYNLKIDKQIVLNEFYPNPTIGQEWIELYNKGENVVNISGWFLNSSNSIYEIENITISPKSHRIFYGNETNITLNDTGDELELLDFSYRLVNIMSYQNNENISENYTYLENESKTIGRATDGSNTWRTFTDGGTPNSLNGDKTNISIHLFYGWNLISFPLATVNPS